MIKKEVFGTGKTDNISVSFTSERLTLAELIQQKVAARVRQLNIQVDNKEVSSRFLSATERLLNQAAFQKQIQDAKLKIEEARLEPEKAGYEALAGFQQNAFFVIIDGQQRENLEEELVLTQDSEVQFIRLVPLVGG